MARRRVLVWCAALLALSLAAPATADAQRRPVYKTPGYKGIKKAPRTRAPRPPQPIPLAPVGTRPEALVDDAGTAHVVWNEEGGSAPDVMHYCRLPRGATACDNPEGTRSFVPDQPYDGGNDPAFNEDYQGPRVVSVGDQIVLLTRRYPNAVPKPGEGDVDTSVYLWVSEDGGQSFSGPGLAGDGFLSGGALAFTVNGSDRIGTISDTDTGGTYFQALRPGAFTSGTTNLGEGDVNRAYGGSLAPDGGGIATAFADLNNQIFVRRWSAAGDPSDAGTWSQEAPIAGSEPHLAGGPAGLFLLNRSDILGPYYVRPVPAGGPGRAVRVSNTDDEGQGDLFQDAGGGLHAGWLASGRQGPELLRRFSADGRNFRTSTLLARDSALGNPDLGAAFDGGGFAVFESSTGIAASAFGNPGQTGRPGLGARSGGGLPPGTVSECQRVSFGAVKIGADEGCLLGTVRGGGVKVSEGPLRLNGLEIVPDAGVKIILDPRERKIDTTGSVRVLLRGPGVGEIVIWHGELHLRLPNPGAGTLLASFPMSDFAAVVKGFPVEGKIDVILTSDGVRIPVFLELPPEFGGITGEAVLIADNARGLRLDSLKVEVKNTLIGPLELKKLRFEWSSGDRWEGEFLLGLPPRPLAGDLGASVAFEDGDFVRASVTVPIPPPGIQLFPGVYISEIGAAFGLKPLEVEGSIQVEAVEVVVLNGTVRGIFPSGRPSELSLEVNVSLFDEFNFANAKALIRTDGYFESTANVGIDLVVASVTGEAVIVVDGPRGVFGAEFGAEVCVIVCGSGKVVLTSEGTGACASLFGEEVYARYRWGDDIPGGVDVDTGSCNLFPVPVRPSASQAGGFALTVARDSRVESLQVHGGGGAPSVFLTAPDGQRVEVAAQPGPGVRAWGAALPNSSTMLVALPDPQPGTWRVEAAPGSPPIESVEQRRDTGPLAVSARVGKARGGARLLRYRVERQPETRVRFVERGNVGGGEIGYARGARGTLRFQPGPGRGGRRQIVAIVEREGLPGTSKVVARYKAPGPVRPARVRGLRARRRGKAVQVSWRATRGANRYAVRVSSNRGMSRMYLVRGRKLRVRGIRRGDRVRVNVRGLSREGLLGRPSNARLRR